MDVMTMGDSGYYEPISMIADQMQTLHPDADCYIYDWGFTDEQRGHLSSLDNTAVIPWDIPYTLDTVERIIGVIEKVLKYDHFPWSDSFKQLLTTDEGYRKVWGPLRRRKEAYMKERIYCLLDCIDRIDGPLVLLDADAIPLAPLDVMNEDFDIGVTRRPQEQAKTDKKKGKYTPLNGGVVFFNTESQSIQTFAQEWRDRAENCPMVLQEQTSLCTLVEEADPDLYSDYYNTGTLVIDDVDLEVKVFPCDRWNYWYYDSIENVDPEENRILHLKSGRHSEHDLERIIREVTS